MLRILLPLACLAAPAAAQDDISALIAAEGVTGAEATLAARPDPGPTERFALGGLRFLAAIEGALQTRYRHGLSGETIPLPVLRLPVATNPAPEPFEPGVIAAIFDDLRTGMAGAEAPLAGLEGEVGLRLDLADIWLDVNANGRRDAGEGIVDLAAGTILPAGTGDGVSAPVIRFDTADAAWLQAYTHFIAGSAEMVLAFDPTGAIARVLDAAAAYEERGAGTRSGFVGPDLEGGIDLVATVYLALQQQPSAERTRAARAHFLEMIRLNRRFWDLVEAETDDDAEWVPNARQASALGIDLPEETGETWRAVLADAEALLTGEKLIPYWRLGDRSGLNLHRLLEDPVPVNVVEWVQGMGLLPYAERGERVSAESWRRFSALVGGRSMLYAVFLN